ncbi:hypothetical protein BHE74_00007454 [Ensete ventricosum]|nr:hypothetical protein BHE74_00007454 [Ensete ventricosum]
MRSFERPPVEVRPLHSFSRVTTSRATYVSWPLAGRYTLSRSTLWVAFIRQARLAACRRESVAALAAQLGELLGGWLEARVLVVLIL